MDLSAHYSGSPDSSAPVSTGALFFIPRSWGGINDDGMFVQARESLAIFLGIVASFFVIWLLDRVEKLVEENKSLRRELDSMRGEANATGTAQTRFQGVWKDLDC